MVSRQDPDQSKRFAHVGRGFARVCLASALALGASAAAVLAFEPGRSDFVFSSDLANDGFTPFATSGTGSAIYGMRRETDLYLCFIADQGDDQAERQRVLLAELAGETPQRTVPNIPVVCILTQ